MTDKRLIVISGPTAVGKSSIAVKLASEINGEIISADSMQVYKNMDIGTAKIKKEEMMGIPHHLIDIIEPEEDYNVTLFKNMAYKAIEDIRKRGRYPIIAGGTGFYIQSLLYDVDFSDTSGTKYRESLFETAKEKGNGYLYEELIKCDPEAASYIHANDLKRVTRALEYYHETGKRISDHNNAEKNKEPVFDFCYFVLNIPRDELYERIDARVDAMIKAGLVGEVERLLDGGCKKGMVSMQGLGYKEIIEYLEGNISLDEAVRIIKRDTRHFAKRQLTWFKRERNVIWINKDEFDHDEDRIVEFMIKRGRNEQYQRNL